MADVKCIKVATDMFNSRKIKQIEAAPKSDTILVIWLKLLLLAGNINDGGAIYVTPDVPYTMETLAAELRRSKTMVKSAMGMFEQYGMIEVTDGIIRLLSWEKYQTVDEMERIRKQTRERVARSREKKSVTLHGVTSSVTSNVTCSATPPAPSLPPASSPLGSPSSFSPLTPLSNTPYNPPNNAPQNTHNPLSFVHSFACAREEGPETEEDEDALLRSYFSPSTVEDATDEERADLLRHIKERRKRRIIHGEYGKGVVMLSEEQIDALIEELSEDEFKKCVGIVADMELSGKHYKNKTHFQAILEIAKKDREV